MIVHFKGESAGNNKSRHTGLFYKAMHIFVKKHYKGMRGWVLKILLYAGIVLRALISLLALPLRLLFNSIVNALQNNEKDIHLIGDTVSTTQAEKIILKHKLKKTFSPRAFILNMMSFPTQMRLSETLTKEWIYF